MDDDSEEARRRELFFSVLNGSEMASQSPATARAEFGARSRRGRVRSTNDDHYLVIRFGRYQDTLLTSLSMRDLEQRFDECAYAAVVADGIGSGGAGAVAARLALSTLAHLARHFGKWDMRIDPQTAADIIVRSEWFYRRTHDALLRRRVRHAELGRMATTMTGFHSVGTDLFVTHVGHSRCYLFRHGTLTQLTNDQTLREHFVLSAQPAAVDKAMEDLEHVLTDVIGSRAEPGVTVERFEVMDDDCVLLCTNGLTDMVEDDAIADVLSARRSADEQCELLVEMALARGGEDDTTAVLAHYDIPGD
jgi:protein phosphatase